MEELFYPLKGLVLQEDGKQQKIVSKEVGRPNGKEVLKEKRMKTKVKGKGKESDWTI